MKEVDRIMAPNEDASGQELSLYDIYRILVKRKFVLLGLVVATQMIAASYVLLQKPYYESAVRLLPGSGCPESMADLAQYGLDSTCKSTVRLLPGAGNSESITDLEKYGSGSSEKDAFASFQQMLGENWSWRSFVSAYGNLPLTKDAAEDLLDNMEHPISVQSESDNVVVTYRDYDRDSVNTVLLRYLEFVHEKYAAQVVGGLVSKIERARHEVESDIRILKKRAALQRMDEIERIKMDIDLAKSLGIYEFQAFPLRNGSGGNAVAYIVDGALPRYMRGVRFLSGELKALVERKSDEPFIAGLRDLEIELEQLNTLNLKPEDYRAYVQDGDVIGPREYRQLRMMPAIVIATGIGLLIGAFFAIFTELSYRGRSID